MKSGLQIGRNFAQEIALYNESGAIAAIASAKRITSKTTTAAAPVAIVPVAIIQVQTLGVTFVQ
ncbi:MAG TPA: hypothetical protein DDW91_09255, partial [Shewanella frigidimarina]|nr:hypothetical protein [Shewanella frigidimarina]